jgi:hypothetical protein
LCIQLELAAKPLVFEHLAARENPFGTDNPWQLTDFRQRHLIAVPAILTRLSALSSGVVIPFELFMKRTANKLLGLGLSFCESGHNQTTRRFSR